MKLRASFLLIVGLFLWVTSIDYFNSWRFVGSYNSTQCKSSKQSMLLKLEHSLSICSF